MNSWKLPGVRSKLKMMKGGEKEETNLNTIENKETATTTATTSPLRPPTTATSNSSTPSPSASLSSNEPKSGVLLIRVCEARGISPPSDVKFPSPPPQPAVQSRGNRDSLTRKQNWWLPYVVLEFDKNEVLIDSLGGETANPVYQYRANL